MMDTTQIDRLITAFELSQSSGVPLANLFLCDSVQYVDTATKPIVLSACELNEKTLNRFRERVLSCGAKYADIGMGRNVSVNLNWRMDGVTLSAYYAVPEMDEPPYPDSLSRLADFYITRYDCGLVYAIAQRTMMYGSDSLEPGSFTVHVKGEKFNAELFAQLRHAIETGPGGKREDRVLVQIDVTYDGNTHVLAGTYAIKKPEGK